MEPGAGHPGILGGYCVGGEASSQGRGSRSTGATRGSHNESTVRSQQFPPTPNPQSPPFTPQGMGLYWGEVRPINKQGHLLGHIKVGGGRPRMAHCSAE